MFRHVVMFRWAPDSSRSERQSAIDALKDFGSDMADFASLTVAEDAGVSEGNFDAVVVVDLADTDAYLRYASDPRHINVLTDHVRPILAERAAVQYHLT